jgi:hypothetical protein
MLTIRYLVEHAIALFFGVLLGFAIKKFPPSADSIIEWILGGVLFFIVYSTVVEWIKRWALFWANPHHRVRGLYAEIYLRGADALVVAPFLVLHHVASDELSLLGRAFTVDTKGDISGGNVSWKSKAISIAELKGETHELAYLFAGQRDGSFEIHGTTRVGVPISASGDTGPRRGYFIDTDIKEPALGATENKPFGSIQDLAASVDAVRFFSIKFDHASYRALRASCDRWREKFSLWLRVSCEPNEDAFKHFLSSAGLSFLAAHTQKTGPYQDIWRHLNAAARQPAAAVAAMPAPVPAAPAAPEQIEGTG